MPSFTRRRFLGGAAAAAPLLLLPKRTQGQPARPPSERLQLALIGVGGRGRDAFLSLTDEKFVALCDVDDVRGRRKVYADPRFATHYAALDSARWFKDYRVMLAEMGDQLDGVVVCTPDHTHYPIAMAVLRQRKPLYLEKPLARCITEVRAIQQAAAKAGVVTQMGNQGRAGEGIRLAREWIQAGLIGEVHTVHAFSDRPLLPWFIEPEAAAADARHESVPATLDWDLWLGPAPQRPFRSLYVPERWRSFFDFGCGPLGDMGCHHLDAAFYALDLGAPAEVEAITTPLQNGCFPKSTVVTWRFPRRGSRGPVEMKWFDGGLIAPRPADVPPSEWKPGRNGSVIYGSEGTLAVAGQSRTCRIVPEKRMRALAGTLPPRTIPRVPGGQPHQEWAAAIRGGPKCGSNFDYGAPLSELVLLGVAAIRAQTRLVWDSAALQFRNERSADRLLGPGYEYRPGWGV